ncbi:MAG TPA: ATP-binding cassette domain-containing protein, partial [Candidatus Brocadiales bacterium]|nr:ATP-binding cassette domain-containing protein [Candidatus Brocadiales bacterium]
MNGNIAIKIENLTKIYKDFERKQEITAIADLNIEIHKGEVLGICGAVGSGKTTLGRLLSGNDIPTSGSITISEKSPTDPKVKNTIGVLPDKSFVQRFSNAEEALNFLGRSSSVPREQRKRWIGQLLVQFGLDKVRKSPVKGFSERMLRKLNFALALINNPEFLILDEPFEGLEPSDANEIKDIIQDLKKRGKTIVILTDTAQDIQGICDRTLVLEKGQLRVTAPVPARPPEVKRIEAPIAVKEKAIVQEEVVEEEITRRNFFAIAGSSLIAIISFFSAIPLAVYTIAPALRKEVGRWIEMGDAAGYSPGTPSKATTTVVVMDGWAKVKKSQNLFVMKDESGQFIIFSDRCTHLGCAVRWDGEKRQFLCPCHNGIFDIDGNVVAGPPPEPLRKLNYKIAEGKLL